MDNAISFDIEYDRFIRSVQQLPDAMQEALKALARETAERIATEARSRLDRALSGASTGLTRQGIRVEPARDHDGYVVVARRNPYPILPYWIEKGTQHMPARPFFDVAAQLEEANYRRRVIQVLQQAVDEAGLGG